MDERQQKVIIGSLLHDIGKVVYRTGIHKKHSVSGAEFLKDEGRIQDKEILNQVKYHHAAELRAVTNRLDKKDLSYITYQADNLASGIDRRKKETDEGGFVKDIPLDSIFNILNHNNSSKQYPLAMLTQGKIPYPDAAENVTSYDKELYSQIKNQIEINLQQMTWSNEYVNSILGILEATLSFVPSSTYQAELCDISLYDHAKITAAFASCIYEWLTENDIDDWKATLFTEKTRFRQVDAFLMYSFDLSGIQSFIYTISTKKALKTLRSRSFYLDFLTEHLADELLQTLDLSRANLIYAGGGHAYFLLANTQKTKAKLEQFETELSKWLLSHYKTDLYYAAGYAACSGDDLANDPPGSYRDIFSKMSEMISQKKYHRYDAATIMALNRGDKEDGVRECSVCHRLDMLDDTNKCEYCNNFEEMSMKIMKENFFLMLQKEKEGSGLMYPFDRWLYAVNKEQLHSQIQDSPNYVRSYSKNQLYTGNEMTTTLWIGDYRSEDEFAALAEQSNGIKRIGVIRADVDGLGQAFVRGFERKEEADRFVTLSRTATFSRKMSLFFKYHINDLLEHGTYFLDPGQKTRSRNATIVYAGGDDIFIVGAWDDIIGFSIDLYHSFQKYTDSTLTFSAGIGIYRANYPISVIAQETGELEERAKTFDPKRKDAICLFNEDTTYHWDVFIDKVLGEKFKVITEFFDSSKDHGKSFLYHLLHYMENRDDTISIARFMYTLSRLQPEKNATDKEKEHYYTFSERIFEWIKSEEETNQTITAMNLYAYLRRENLHE